MVGEMERIDNTEPVGILNTKESELGPSMRKNCIARIEKVPVSSSTTENKFKRANSQDRSSLTSSSAGKVEYNFF